MPADMAGLSPISERASSSLMPAWHKVDDPPARGDRMSETTDPALDLNADRLREECAVFGIFGHPDAAPITALRLPPLPPRAPHPPDIAPPPPHPFHSH